MRMPTWRVRPGWTVAAPLATAIAGALAVAVPVPAAPTAVTQDYGPFTCLNGFVWREAVVNDVVCVTPEVRAQTRQDNNLAAARRNPNGGPYGPDTCLSGYVWREAVANDRVCVTPPTREQARSDNAQAASRRNDLRTVVTREGSSYLVRTTRINVGPGFVGLYRSGTVKPIRSWRRTAGPNPTGAPGGFLWVRTAVVACSGAANAYFRVWDSSSTRWSSRVPVCARV